MCSKPKTPAPLPLPPPPPAVATIVDPQVVATRSDEVKVARAASGRSGTILAGDLSGTEDPNTTKKSILG